MQSPDNSYLPDGQGEGYNNNNEGEYANAVHSPGLKKDDGYKMGPTTGK